MDKIERTKKTDQGKKSETLDLSTDVDLLEAQVKDAEKRKGSSKRDTAMIDESMLDEAYPDELEAQELVEAEKKKKTKRMIYAVSRLFLSKKAADVITSLFWGKRKKKEEDERDHEDNESETDEVNTSDENTENLNETEAEANQPADLDQKEKVVEKETQESNRYTSAEDFLEAKLKEIKKTKKVDKKKTQEDSQYKSAEDYLKEAEDMHYPFSDDEKASKKGGDIIKEVAADKMMTGTNIKFADILSIFPSREGGSSDTLCGYKGENSIGIFQFYSGGELPLLFNYIKNNESSDVWQRAEIELPEMMGELKMLLNKSDQWARERKSPKYVNVQYNNLFKKHRKDLQLFMNIVAEKQVQFKMELVQKWYDDTLKIAKKHGNSSIAEAFSSLYGVRFIADNCNQRGWGAFRKDLIRTCGRLKGQKDINTYKLLKTCDSVFTARYASRFSDKESWVHGRKKRNRAEISDAMNA